MKTLPCLALLLLLANTAAAQPRTAPRDSTTSSLSVGNSFMNFRFADSDSAFIYAFKGSATTIRLSSESGSLSFSYGSDIPDSFKTTPSRRLFDAAISTGGNTMLFDDLLGQQLAVYIPIRLNLGYRNLSYNTDELLVAQERTKPLHLASASLGAGGGVRFRPPSQLPLIRDHLVVFSSLTFSLGGLANAQEKLKEIHIANGTDFTLEARWERLLGGRLGLTAGYTYHTQRWSSDVPRSLLEAVDTIKEAKRLLDEKNRQHLFYLGVNW